MRSPFFQTRGGQKVSLSLTLLLGPLIFFNHEEWSGVTSNTVGGCRLLVSESSAAPRCCGLRFGTSVIVVIATTTVVGAAMAPSRCCDGRPVTTSSTRSGPQTRIESTNWNIQDKIQRHIARKIQITIIFSVSLGCISGNHSSLEIGPIVTRNSTMDGQSTRTQHLPSITSQ